jgi:hypothetical protein
MKNLKTINYNGVLILVFTLFFVNNLLSQENQFVYSDNLSTVTGEVPDPNETPAGYWNLVDKKINVIKSSNEGPWSLNKEGETNCLSIWKDFLEIKHTIDCKLTWSVFPYMMKPGTDMKVSSEFVSNEYSTTSMVQTGIKISVADYTSVDILNIKKNYNNHQNEKREVNFKIPSYNDTKTLLIGVDCYVGKEHYILNYIYNWVYN